MITGKVDSRAGKSTGNYADWWNIANVKTCHKSSENLGVLQGLERVTEEVSSPESEMETYAVNVPQWRYHEPECEVAKEKELENFDKFDVYKEIKV